ncbi:hypothetical protein CcI156_06770 [Frankia sp. CcI156]|jgi:hypothetical protein|nr:MULTISPECIES: hypothetical protein [Frankia]ETA04207.1 hypothetical protein CcI6DRAFT_00422 [Frankia sp. CcI6]EYT93949.1 hypothetical protein ThrDRAFT_00320 [Frankia casuarinae]KDA44575.1 hypothetical protein BMG523Draft_00425 [Frankia sp. BMG5.23]KFB05578.1 hypothetical protein ALLO2DRAFT_01530 [Frankia sp. Allo2]OAA27649.1 hypothetical protein AAY23_102260 [Frankia casuarinae]
MGSEDLVCARCAGLVVEGRCPTCRASREYLRQNFFQMSPQVIVALIAIVMLLAVLAARHVS